MKTMTKNVMKLALLGLLTISQSFAVDINLKASELKWKATKVSGEHYGRIFFKSGDIVLKDNKLVSGNFTVDVNSLTVDDLSGKWAEKFTGHIKSKDFFTVAEFPEAKLKIKSIDGSKVTADLTIKGKTNTVNFDYKVEGKTLIGKLKFDRTKYGMVYGSGDFFKGLGDKMIHNNVTLDFKVVTK